jgi:two-component system, NarL family, nitrate/nitrite response regulator NarL
MASATSLPQLDDRIRILVADSTRMGSQLLSEALKRSGRFEVTASVATSLELLSAVGEGKPQVVILTPHLDDEEGKGFTLTRQLRASHPHIKAVILVDSSSRDVVVEAFRVGARGVFCRSNSIKDLCKCIDVIYRGQIWAGNHELEFVLEVLGKALPSRLVDSKGIALLSKREQDVIRSLSEGLTNREIAAQLKLSEHTVKNYLLRIFDKLGVSNRAEAILYAFSQSGPAPTLSSSEPGGVFHQGELATLEWFQQAAQRGYGVAQFILGQMYRDGYGVPEDKLSAYMWFLLAERTGDYVDESIREAKERLAGKMKTEQIAQAQRRALAWIREHTEQSQAALLVPPEQVKGPLATAGVPGRGFSRRARSLSLRALESPGAKTVESTQK